MGGPRIKRCKLGACRDRLLRGGNRVQCTICGDIFPCRHDCKHYDCILVRTGECTVQELVTFASPEAAWEGTSNPDEIDPEPEPEPTNAITTSNEEPPHEAA